LELDKIRKQWTEAQCTLEELGIQLSVSKLQISEMQEQRVNANDSIGNNQDPGGGISSNIGTWTPDKMTSQCKGCNRDFSITRRKVIFCLIK